MKVAFFKGTKTGGSGLYERAIRAWELGPYSHVELIFSDGRAGSSTFLEGGVRVLPPGGVDITDVTLWDVIELPAWFDESLANTWFETNDTEPYDVWGCAHLVIGFVREQHGTAFCSEAVAASLGFNDAWRFDPNALHAVLSRFAAHN